MGEMTVLITGASGFLGRACVEAALARGHRVRALVRSAAQLPQGVDVARGDLSEGVPQGALDGVDCVIHVAAALSNDWPLLRRDTVTATRTLAEAMAKTSARAVLASSIGVYAADAEATAIDEATCVETHLSKRENYTKAKIAQEALFKSEGLKGYTLRIGAIFGEGQLWNAHIGLRRGPLLMSFGRSGEVPLVHVDDAAMALVLAAEADAPHGMEPLNIVGDDLPSRAAFIKAIGAKLHIPLHWRGLMPIAALAEALLGAGAPGLLRPKVLKARMAAHVYPNEAAKARLRWAPQHHFAEGHS